jgi:hypothetical protein
MQQFNSMNSLLYHCVIATENRLCNKTRAAAANATTAADASVGPAGLWCPPRINGALARASIWARHQTAHCLCQ